MAKKAKEKEPPPPKPKPKPKASKAVEYPPDMAPAVNDAYTGMLTISLLALVGAGVLLYLDFAQYPDAKPPALPKRPLIEEVQQAPPGGAPGIPGGAPGIPGNPFGGPFNKPPEVKPPENKEEKKDLPKPPDEKEEKKE